VTIPDRQAYSLAAPCLSKAVGGYALRDQVQDSAADLILGRLVPLQVRVVGMPKLVQPPEAHG